MRPTRPERADIALPVRDRSVRPAQSEPAGRRLGWLLLLVSPGLWVAAIIGLGIGLHLAVPLIPLLAAAPAIACAGTGRRLCIALGCACALIALVPFGGQPAALGERIGTASAVVAVSFASYLVVYRRIRMQRAYDEVRQVAEVTQRVLLRPIPERIGPVATAVEYLSAATGARVGGDFYEVIDTPYGVRAILGDMRGHGLDAVSGAAALLGTFREAGAIEPTLEAVAARLDAALTRHTAVARRAELTAAERRDEFHGLAAPGSGQREARGEDRTRTDDEDPSWAEDFATAVLVQVPYEQALHGTKVITGSAMNGAGRANGNRAAAGLEPWRGTAANGHGTYGFGASENGVNEAKLVVCGHPAPYLIRGDQTLPLEPERPTLPLGLGSLVDEPYTATSSVVPFEPGDALVFYTDGVSDARDQSGEFFGLEAVLCDLAGVGFDVHDDVHNGDQDGVRDGGLDGVHGRRDGVDGGRAPQSVAETVRFHLLEHMRRKLNDDAALLVLGRLSVDA